MRLLCSKLELKKSKGVFNLLSASIWNTLSTHDLISNSIISVFIER